MTKEIYQIADSENLTIAEVRTALQAMRFTDDVGELTTKYQGQSITEIWTTYRWVLLGTIADSKKKKRKSKNKY